MNSEHEPAVINLGNPPGTVESIQSMEKNSRILVIDDMRAIHDDFRKILCADATAGALDEAEAALFGNSSKVSSQGKFTLDSAFQGSEGLALVQRAVQEGNRYAMAFIDVRMPPGWDGIETTQKIWEVDPDLQVVICTAYSDYSWDEMIERIGNSDRLVILKKPFDTVEALQLANALTEKWSLLQQTRKKMGGLEKLVAERTRHLQETNLQLETEIARRKRREEHLALQSDVTCILADANATSSHVLTRVLELICQELHWDTGALWLVDQHAKVLRWSATWHPPGPEFGTLKEANEQVVFTAASGLPGRVWSNSQPEWVSDLSKESDPRGKAALEAGLQSAVAFPLHLRGEILGVAEFHCAEKRSPENDLTQIFTMLGSLIGQSIERKKLEDQLRHSQKMDAIGCLAGGVAHDFNNILTIIQGYAQIVEMKENLDGETAEGLNQITQAAQRASSLTRQLLTFSRKQVMQFRDVNLNKALENLAKMLQRIIGEDVVLKLNYHPEPTFVPADEDMIAQILMNLTVNARDAMPKGGKLEISTEPITVYESGVHRHAEAKVGEFICLRVSDTGCGVASENLSHIFEPFFTTKGVGRGTGLGLSTVYGIVKQHNGWIEVSSQINIGTTFRIFLPRAVVSTRNGETAKGKSENVGGNETLLLVEDEAAVRQLARTVLLMHGYKVIEASSGLDALSVWKQHASEIDLLLTDIIMPGGINGRELAQKLKMERPELNIVFTSGYDPDKMGMEAELGEEVNFLSKPYSPQKLLEAVRQGLAFNVMAVAC
jgi:signal transduction histidine kinase/FixJ family two-component response regulator